MLFNCELKKMYAFKKKDAIKNMDVNSKIDRNYQSETFFSKSK